MVEVFLMDKRGSSDLEAWLVSDAAVLWTPHTGANCFHTDSNCHDKTLQPDCDCGSDVQYVMVQTQLNCADELTWMSKAVKL